MKKYLIMPIALLSLTACNTVMVEPQSLDTNQTFYADRGGYSMKQNIKDVMEERGYRVVVGKSVSTKDITGDEDFEIDTSNTMGARYIVKVKERREDFQPLFCMFDGFWWWNYSVSIADQRTGKELLSWRGQNCANSSIRKLNNILDEMEK